MSLEKGFSVYSEKLISRIPEKQILLFFFICLFICVYIVWAISLHYSQPPFPSSPRFQAESVLPFSLILLKRKYKQ
jgi:hypothetical protein